jgi:hypothetical protein
MNMSSDSDEKLADYNHVLLYAKLHYKRSDNIKRDLSIILQHRSCLTEPDESWVWGCMIDCLFKYVPAHTIERELFSNMFREEYGYGRPSEVTSMNNVLGIMLNLMSRLSVKDGDGNWLPGLNLGEPDPNILPLSK